MQLLRFNATPVAAALHNHGRRSPAQAVVFGAWPKWLDADGDGQLDAFQQRSDSSQKIRDLEKEHNNAVKEMKKELVKKQQAAYKEAAPARAKLRKEGVKSTVRAFWDFGATIAGTATGTYLTYRFGTDYGPLWGALALAVFWMLLKITYPLKSLRMIVGMPFNKDMRKIISSFTLKNH